MGVRQCCENSKNTLLSKDCTVAGSGSCARWPVAGCVLNPSRPTFGGRGMVRSWALSSLSIMPSYILKCCVSESLGVKFTFTVKHLHFTLGQEKIHLACWLPAISLGQKVICSQEDLIGFKVITLSQALSLSAWTHLLSALEEPDAVPMPCI